MKFLKFLGHLLFIIVLTVFTQIGGLVWILSIIISKKFKKRYSFFIIYLLFNLIIIPPIAKSFGRVRLPISSKGIITPKNIFYPLLFRNYVNLKLMMVLEETAVNLNSKFPNSKLIYLDANFPFINNFPLLPHLSHSDGKKIDLSFFYLEKNGSPTNDKPNFIGYGVFEEPYKNEINTSNNCEKKGYWQYDYPKYLALSPDKSLQFDKKRTKFIIEQFAKNSLTQKIFIEPHLKSRLNLSSKKVRFHGCRAVRHDDHIHLQTH